MRDQKFEDKLREIKDRSIARQLDLAKRLAGPHFDELLVSRQNVLISMAHVDANVRSAAIICGSAKWGLSTDPAFQELCCGIANSDDKGPRMTAINELGHTFSNTKARIIQSVLVSIVEDSNVPTEIRNLAYRELRRIEFGDLVELGEELSIENEFVLRGDAIPLALINWEFVQSLR